MVEPVTFHGAFNARWLSAAEVARQFVPIPQFLKLAHPQHAILLGPRGSGKTTLLKMLTRRALRVWRDERAIDAPLELPTLAYEAVYIPSDTRWSYELRSLSDSGPLNNRDIELVQRALVAASCIVAIIDAADAISQDVAASEADVCAPLRDLWQMKASLPTYVGLRRTAELLAARLRAAVNRDDRTRIRELLDAMPDQFLGHVTDLPILSCAAIAHLLPAGENQKWALCFDEVEIAPQWLRQELLSSQRSVDQRFLIKVTASPLLPSGVLTSPEAGQDYQLIRLWQSHVEDAQAFCENLARNFLARRFTEEVTPSEFFGSSPIAVDESVFDESAYERRSMFYKEAKELAVEDSSFARALLRYGIDPADPYTEDMQLRDKFFRKVKPIVLLRRAFRRSGRRRSVRVFTVYSGREAIYAISEGNPRWLTGVLTELYDRWLVSRYQDRRTGRPRIKDNEQAKALNSAARRFHASLAAAASAAIAVDQATTLQLTQLLDRIGEGIAAGMLDVEFPIDPVGSFTVEEHWGSQGEQVLEKALELGAIVYVGRSEDDVPRHITGGRFRLAFLLSPLYKLPFRNYRAVQLGTLLRSDGPDQIDLFTKDSADSSGEA